MSEMIVQVRNKMLRRIGGVNHFVSHNKDYTIQFQFDESWDNVRTKMAVFAYEDGEYGSEIFDGDTCNVPELPREGRILIGVKAGEDLSTELLCIPVCKSADDVITDEYDEPDPKIYEQILDIINNLWNGGTTVYPSPVRFLAAPNKAEVGQFVRVKKVDENGEVEETEAVDVESEKELVVVNITEDADGVLHADMTYDEINPLRYTHAIYAKWASGMYPYSTSAKMYFGEDLKNVFVFSSSMAGMENWRIAIAQDGSVKISSYELELAGRKVQTIDETTGNGDDAEKNYPSAKAVYDALANVKDKDAVKFVEQELTEEQKQQARDNIGVQEASYNISGTVKANGTKFNYYTHNCLYVNAGGGEYNLNRPEGLGFVDKDVASIPDEETLRKTLYNTGGLAGIAIAFQYEPFTKEGIEIPCYMERIKYSFPSRNNNYVESQYIINDSGGNQFFARASQSGTPSGYQSVSWYIKKLYQNLNFPVTITPTITDGVITYAADKTFAEIKAAYESGVNVYAIAGEDISPLSSIEGGLYPVITFGSVVNNYCINIKIYTDNTVRYKNYFLGFLNIVGTTYATNGSLYIYIPEGDFNTITVPEPIGADLGYVLKVGEQALEWVEDTSLPSPPTAQVGQIVKVKSVDESGKITETETVDMPTKTLKWITVHSVDLTETKTEYVVSTDTNGKPISDYSPITLSLIISTPADSTQENTNGSPWVYPSATISDNTIRAIGNISGWKTVARDSAFIFSGNNSAMSCTGNVNTSFPTYKLTNYSLNGVKIFFNSNSGHLPIGTHIEVAILCEVEE